MTSFVIPDFLYSDNAAVLFRWEDKFDLLLYYWNSSQETKRKSNKKVICERVRNSIYFNPLIDLNNDSD